MGYYANGSGTISFDRVLDEKTFNELLNRLRETFECDGTREFVPFGCKEAVSCIDIWNYEKYYGDDVEDALNAAALAGPIGYGEICYTGEDNELWRFIYEDGHWAEENGHVEYGDHSLTFDYMASAIRRFVESEQAISESAAIYQKLTHDFGFTDQDLLRMDLNWLLDLAMAAS